MRRLVLAALAALALAAPAHAIVGGRPADAALKGETAMIVSTRGASCTGVVLAPNALLTAAHCVQPQADYAVVVFEASGPRLIPINRIALHPSFDPNSFETRRPTPDLALVRLSGSAAGGLSARRRSPRKWRCRPAAPPSPWSASA